MVYDKKSNEYKYLSELDIEYQTMEKSGLKVYFMDETDKIIKEVNIIDLAIDNKVYFNDLEFDKDYFIYDLLGDTEWIII